VADPEYTVRRSDRARRARLTVTPDGVALVVLPRRAPASVAAELVSAHAIWLRRQVGRIRTANAKIAARPGLETGRTLTVGGVPFRIVVSTTQAARSSVAVHRPIDGELGILEIKRQPASAAPVSEILEGLLRREARHVLVARVEAMAPIVGVPVPVVTIRAQRSRWGSASRSGRVSLNWRLILAPPSVLEYVVIHELAHLRVAGHSARFWTLVRRHFPETAAARAWLRANHAELLAALD
jgi:predicted metal-dependent hydrolase